MCLFPLPASHFHREIQMTSRQNFLLSLCWFALYSQDNTLIFTRCIYDVLRKVSHINLFFFLFLYLFRCVCNIDCSQTNFNPLCASDGKSYDNACQIKEASCQKQEKIEVMSLGRCQGNSHNKTHFKECFQFLFREKKIKEPGLGSYLAIVTLQFIL